MLHPSSKVINVLPAALRHKFIPQRRGICQRIKCLYPCKSCVVFWNERAQGPTSTRQYKLLTSIIVSAHKKLTVITILSSQGSSMKYKSLISKLNGNSFKKMLSPRRTEGLTCKSGTFNIYCTITQLIRQCVLYLIPERTGPRLLSVPCTGGW